MVAESSLAPGHWNAWLVLVISFSVTHLQSPRSESTMDGIVQEDAVASDCTTDGILDLAHDGLDAHGYEEKDAGQPKVRCVAG
jgi:hypothetical protein